MNAPVAYSVLDAAGKHVAANHKFWELFGLRPGSDLSVLDITAADSRSETSDYLAELLRGERPSVVIDKRYVRADGSEFWGRLTAQRLDTGTEPLLLGVIEDIDGQRELEQRLRQMANEQSEFVARVSHELRNPLHTIAGLAELLSTSDVDDQAKRQASIIVREAQGLTSIVSDLLDIGKYDTGNLALDSSPFTVRGVIDRSARSARSLAQAKGLKVQTRVDDAVPIYALGDAGRLGQVIDNLCGNAIKFTTVGTVTLAVRRGPEDMVEVRVSDTGPGIPAERQAEIFEPFQRLNSSAPGAGLGLAISSRLATSMGGSLSLEASGHDGSTFLLAVPLPVASAPADNMRRPHPDQGARRERVLVVEDNVETQMLASAQLTRLGYEHDIVGDGYSALALSEQVEFGAILMDWHLPGIDGLETTRRIRQREAREGRSRTPIISVTARAMAEDIEACMQAGADDFIAKPASMAMVAETLERWTGSPQAAGDDVVVDSDVFSALLEELADPALVLTIARTFLSEMPHRVQAMVGTSPEATELAAHTLKSTSAMLGASALRDVAAEIEEVSRAGKPVPPSLLQRLEAGASETDHAVRALIKKLEGAS